MLYYNLILLATSFPPVASYAPLCYSGGRFVKKNLQRFAKILVIERKLAYVSLQSPTNFIQKYVYYTIIDFYEKYVYYTNKLLLRNDDEINRCCYQT